MNDIALRPIYCASVSGGKDSLYMLKVILDNPQKYPLDMVFNIDTEIEWDWEKKAVDYIEQECKKANIKFVKIKPRKSWAELEEKYYIQSRTSIWCNGNYKYDANRQLKEWLREQNCKPVMYIGICADETSRFKYNIGDWKDSDICYPLAEEGIEENTILAWAKKQTIFCGWYTHFTRGGCMCCPKSSRKELAYLIINYPDHWKMFKEKIERYENHFGKSWLQEGKMIDEMEQFIVKKYKPILRAEERFDSLVGESNE